MKVFFIDQFGLYGSLCFFIVVVQTALAQQSCESPSGAIGLCVSHKECNLITRTVERYGADHLPAGFLNYLKQLRCASTSKTGKSLYCCENRFLAVQPPTPRPIRTLTDFSSRGDYESQLNANGMAILNEQMCGGNNGKRIAFGQEVDLAEFPWMALLRYDTDSNERAFKCGGSLITNRYVLSAAHCTVGVEFKLIGVRLGEHNLDTDQDCQRKGRETYCTPPVEDYGIERTIPHPGYSSARVVNDVMLIKLDRSVTFKEHIKPICLPTTQLAAEMAEDQRYLVAGWGTTEKGYASSILLKAVISLKSPEVCQTFFRQTRITDAHICAGGPGRVDACQGDSGSPLFFLGPYKNTQRYVQYGIVSFGNTDCGADTTYPGIYANILHLMPWITANID